MNSVGLHVQAATHKSRMDRGEEICGGKPAIASGCVGRGRGSSILYVDSDPENRFSIFYFICVIGLYYDDNTIHDSLMLHRPSLD